MMIYGFTRMKVATEKVCDLFVHWFFRSNEIKKKKTGRTSSKALSEYFLRHA